MIGLFNNVKSEYLASNSIMRKISIVLKTTYVHVHFIFQILPEGMLLNVQFL